MGPLTLAFSVVSGTGTLSVPQQYDHARWIRIVPPGEGTTYNIQMLDGDGDIMLSQPSVLGTLVQKLDFPLTVLSSISVTGSSADGTFKLKIDF